jgi:dTDP-4-dehydrorhamnose reductase
MADQSPGGPAILLTGGSGQVGTEFRRWAPGDWRILAPGRGELDLADAASLGAYLAAHPVAAIVNSGAYTAVDRAESEIGLAWRVNALAPALLAEAAKAADIPLVQVSTDFVFDGAKISAYGEDDPVGPVSVYGASKLGGELAVRTAMRRHVILRTAWVFSPHGANFVKTMLRLGAERPSLRVVDDQIGCPTGAIDIARALIAIVSRMLDDQTVSGTYHFVNGGEATWCGLARAVFETAARCGGPTPMVEAITTADYPTPARRPANSRLSTIKLQRDFGIVPRPWRAAVDEAVDALLNSTPAGTKS